jgi:hypothetical protein
MPKKDWKKVFNLNTYEWWRNHRRVVTFALLLFAFGSYVRYPSAKLLKIKDACGRFSIDRNWEQTKKALNLETLPNFVGINNYCQYFK